MGGENVQTLIVAFGAGLLLLFVLQWLQYRLGGDGAAARHASHGLLRCSAGGVHGAEKRWRMDCPRGALARLRDEARLGRRAALYRDGAAWIVVAGPALVLVKGGSSERTFYYTADARPDGVPSPVTPQPTALDDPAWEALPGSAVALAFRVTSLCTTKKVTRKKPDGIATGSGAIRAFATRAAALAAAPPDTDATRYYVVGGGALAFRGTARDAQFTKANGGRTETTGSRVLRGADETHRPGRCERGPDRADAAG